MGLFDQITSAIGGQSGQPGEGSGALLTAIMQMINSPQTGGFSGLIENFQKGGLGELVNSWVSTGQNLPVSAEQIQNILGNEKIQSLASQLGVSNQVASEQLAATLPQVVDKLTPDGKLPEGGDLLTQGLDLLKGQLFK